MRVDIATEAELRKAAKEFRATEAREYAPKNVDRDLRAVARFIDFLAGRYVGKTGR